MQNSDNIHTTKQTKILYYRYLDNFKKKGDFV